MPYAAIALAVSLLYGVTDPAAAEPSRTSLLASQQTASPMLVFDDEVYGDREGDQDQSEPSDDPDFNYGYEDDEDNSAHGPGDDEDDGWDIDEYERSERA